MLLCASYIYKKCESRPRNIKFLLLVTSNKYLMFTTSKCILKKLFYTAPTFFFYKSY